MKHQLKIEQQYFIHILEGKKTFEIRKNDRDFQVGDKIGFLPLESDEYDYTTCEYIHFNYEITYIHQGFGVCQSYVILGIKPA